MIRRKISIHSVLTPLLALCLLGVLPGCGEQRFQPLDAPDFSLPLLDGSGTASPGELRGKVVYLSFWASWCVPCRQEMPYLAQLWERHRDEGFRVLAINVDEDVEKARAFVDEYQIPFPVLLDTDRTVSSSYRVPGFPTHFIVDRNGRIRFSGLGFNLSDLRAVSEEVVSLLAEESAGAPD
jgi:peroxiredoxin